jgi:hypothetical protein
MTDQELIQQLQAALALLVEVNRELQQRQIKVRDPVLSDGKLAKAPSLKNDPLEFYANCCVMKQNTEITATELFTPTKTGATVTALCREVVGPSLTQ